MASNRGYDQVVDVDTEGDLGNTDLHDDLEFHPSNFEDAPRSKIPSDNSFSNNQTINSKRYLWSLSFYAQFFDVDTNEVLNRCWAALYPRRPFLDVLDGNPDLYGPFWIATTVIFILFVSGTLSGYLSSENDQPFKYNIRLLSGALGLIYGYSFVIPVGLWAVLKWFGSEAANILECWALYGYANLIWIPVALISWSTIGILNWVFCGVGFGVSALFLVRNLWPVVSITDQKTSRILVIIVVILHAGLAFTIKQLFFAHGSLVESGGDKPKGDDKKPEGDDKPDEDQGSKMLFRMFKA